MQQYTDQQLQQKITELQTAIKNWAEPKELWYDCGFHDWLRHVDGEPKSPAVITILWFEGPLNPILNGEYDDGSQQEFSDILEKLGYEYELNDHCSLYIYALDELLSKAFESYFHWQWVCSLIQPDCADVYEELYSYFSNKPERLHDISWREFEILLFRLFQNQGFQAELGPGQGDGGIDIKLLQRDPLGDILTLVQAKQYAPRNKIKLEAVAALHGIADVEKAHKGIFVTTSEYLPSAKNFAGRTDGRLELFTSENVIEWCSTASAEIITDKSKLVSTSQVRQLIKKLNRTRDPRIIHASGGYNIVTNKFALVLKETRYAALLMSLPNYTVSDDGYGQRGYEAPILDERACSMLKPECVWRAKRKADSSGITYWDGSNLYFQWDGNPSYFDWVD